MIVVADTSALNHLVLIDEINLLPALFGHVFLPQAVIQELQHPGAPAKVRRWLESAPDWIEIRTAAPITNLELIRLDPGEREAIQLALELDAGTILIDEIRGRNIAESLHLKVRGTLGILEEASQLGRVNFREAFNKLEQTGFRISPALREQFLRRNP